MILPGSNACILALLVLTPSLADIQAAEPERVVLEWLSVRGARGYVLEIKTAGEQTILKQVVPTSYTVVHLEPGHYQVRITLINKFGKSSPPGDWERYAVVRGIASKALNVEPDRLLATLQPIPGPPDSPLVTPDLRPREDTVHRFDMAPVWRSAVLPGWGQAYQERRFNATVIGGTFAVATLSAALLYPTYYRNKTAYGKREQTATILVGAIPSTGLFAREALARDRHALNAHGRNLNVLTAALAGIYLWNLADVIIVQTGRGEIRAAARPGAEGFDVRFVCTR